MASEALQEQQNSAATAALEAQSLPLQLQRGLFRVLPLAECVVRNLPPSGE